AGRRVLARPSPRADGGPRGWPSRRHPCYQLPEEDRERRQWLLGLSAARGADEPTLIGGTRAVAGPSWWRRRRVAPVRHWTGPGPADRDRRGRWPARSASRPGWAAASTEWCSRPARRPEPPPPPAPSQSRTRKLALSVARRPRPP